MKTEAAISLDLAGRSLPLEGTGHWKPTSHVFEPNDIRAVNLAIAARRPLLLRGEPGCGKSQLARAAAFVLKRAFLAKTVNARCEPEDLLYRFDAVARLAQAQVLRQEKEVQDTLAAENFLLPEILWWALAPGDAQKRYGDAARYCGKAGCDYAKGLLHPLENGRPSVVLIDEIDKADGEVPNSLLEVFSLRGFSLPYGGGAIQAPEDLEPLVIITTNEDRELPPAFVRRCLVHWMNPPETNQDEFFRTRARAHLPDRTKLSDTVLKAVIEQVLRDRQLLGGKELPKPGLAEMLDLLEGLVGQGLGNNEASVSEFAAFAFGKHRAD